MANQNEPSQFRTSVGGQALMEGIMMRGPELIACAVRRPDGSIDLSTEPVRTHWYNKVPMLRGICNMVENLRCGYKYLMYSADISMTEEEAEAEQSAFDHWLEAHVGPKVQDIGARRGDGGCSVCVFTHLSDRLAQPGGDAWPLA